MYEDLLKKKIIVELKNLVDNFDVTKDDIDAYSEFMREMILSTYSEN